MSADNLARVLGNPGKFQMILYIMLCCNTFFVCWNHLAMAFMGAKTKHHCAVGNITQIYEVVPLVQKGGKTLWDGCNLYVNVSTKEEKSCSNGWTYYLEGRERTIISEWDLVCDDAYKSSLATTIYFCGVLVGGLLFGALSDKFGRRPVLLFCVYSPIILGIMISFIRDYIAFVILRFFLGVVLQGLQAAFYIMIIELFALKYRSRVGTIQVIFWAVGVMSLALIAFLIQDWRYIQLFITLTTILQISLIWVLPESFRWLITQKKFEKAKQVVTRIVSFNKLEFPHQVFNDVVEKSTTEEKKFIVKKYTIIDMFRYRVLRKRSIILAWIWFSISVGYYGISLNISSLAGNKYLNFFISGTVELIPYFLTVFITERFGRRKPLCTYLMIGAIMNITAGVLSEKAADNDALQDLTTALAIIGKVGFAGSFSVLFIYTSELFPTEIRNVGLGACTSWTRFGAVIAPQILLLGEKSRKSVPFIIFGSFGFIASLSSLLLFETLNKELSDTIREEEKDYSTEEMNFPVEETTSLPIDK
ncbi:organic cation transporter protein-like [Dendronephthya gigantea]|uniref:organic cation transporter protein-like n=1 Tax=Dendronephthya gigantea TaxID=151771 RepID=UPI00106CBCB0|nr:organic cation transporter protein-like [Dendronephthya gigantea]